MSAYCGDLIAEGEAFHGLATIAQIDPVVESSLRAQLPRQMQRQRLCWYSYKNGLLATDRRLPDRASHGYQFTYSSGQWSLREEEPIIVALPKAF